MAEILEWIDGLFVCRENASDHDEKFSAGFAETFYRSCLHLLSQYFQHPDRSKVKIDHLERTLRRAVDQLVLWGDNFQAGQLDTLLDKMDELKWNVLEILSTLSRALLVGMTTLKLDEDKNQNILEQIKLIKIQLENAGTILDEKDQLPSFKDDSSERSETSNEEPQYILDIISSSNCLMDLGPTLEHLAIAVIEDEEQATTGKNPTFEVSALADLFVRQIADKFTEADTALVERLGEANWQRFARIRIQMESNSPAAEPSRGATDHSNIQMTKSTFNPVSLFQDSGFYSLSNGSQAVRKYEPSVTSHSSFYSTRSEKAGNRPQVPPTPGAVLSGEPFECGFCRRTLLHIKNRVDWKLHIFGDLQPYICTRSSCNASLKTFPTRRMWAAHEFGEHHFTSIWQCLVCKSDFPNAPTLREHINRMHHESGHVVESESMTALMSMAEKRVPIPVADIKCPLCFQSNWGSQRSFVTHLGRHLEEIALATLPEQGLSESEAESDSDNSVITAMRMRRFTPPRSILPIPPDPANSPEIPKPLVARPSVDPPLGPLPSKRGRPSKADIARRAALISATPINKNASTDDRSHQGDDEPHDEGNTSFSYPPPITASGIAAPQGISLPHSDYNKANPRYPRYPELRKHQCPFCSSGLTRYHHLKRHLLIHRQEKPYICQTCQSGFRRLHDLKRHTKLHTGETEKDARKTPQEPENKAPTASASLNSTATIDSNTSQVIQAENRPPANRAQNSLPALLPAGPKEVHEPLLPVARMEHVCQTERSSRPRP